MTEKRGTIIYDFLRFSYRYEYHTLLKRFYNDS